MKMYTIVGGVNGVGKSSFTGVLKEQTTDLGVIIDVDKITAELGGNIFAGGKAALKKIRECIDKNISFTQETTLSGYKTEATAKEVKELGYHVRMFYVGLDTVDESLQRIENRVKRGGHNIPQDVIRRRYVAGLKNLFERFADEVDLWMILPQTCLILMNLRLKRPFFVNCTLLPTEDSRLSA